MRLILISCWSFLLLCLPSGCFKSQSTDRASTKPEKAQIYVVNYPLKYFAERIVGDRAQVVFPAPENVDPAFWKPDAATVAKFQEADLILLNGATYAKWTANVSLPHSKLVDTSVGFHEHLITFEDAVVHSHGPEGSHSHAGIAFVTWLDPQLALHHAQACLDAVIRLLPDSKTEFESNFASLKQDLLALDRQLDQVTQQDPSPPLLASHPVYHYLARRAKWNLRSMHWEPDTMPSEQEWEDLQSLLGKQAARWMIWEAEPTAAIKTRLESVGVSCVVFAPCGNRPASGDYLQVMQQNIQQLAPIFPKQK